MDARTLKHPFGLLLAGPSGCGKSYFISTLISKCHTMIEPPIERVVYVYSEYQPLFDSITKSCPVPIEFIQSLDIVETDKTQPTLIVVDDLMDNPLVEKQVSEFFVKKCHHGNVSMAYMVQNVFHTGKYHRTISLNAHYVYLGKNPRSSDQILRLAMQMFPKQEQFLREAYHDATSQPYGYLFLDFKQTTNDKHRVKTHIFDNHPIVYIPK